MSLDLEDVVDVRPLTHTQEGMLYHSLAEPDSAVFHSQVVSTLPADLDVARFQHAWARLVARHETLRSAVFWDGLDQPLQVVRPSAELDWKVDDLRRGTAEQAASRVERALARDAAATFALDEAPLVRMRLLQHPAGHWTWVWTFHHLILDGWSVRILMRELATLYDDADATLDAPVSPRTYLDWRAQQDLDRSRRFWSEQLDRVAGPQHLELPGLLADGTSHERLDLTLTDALVAALRRTATSRRTTPSALVTAAWSLVVSSVTSSPDVVVGITTSGRPPQLEGVEDVVGMLLATLPLVSRPDGDATVDEYVEQVHRRQLDLVEHQHLGLAELHRLAGIRGSESLFESIVVFENLPPEAPAGATTFDELEFREHSNFPLALLALPGDPFTLRLVHDTSRFSAAAAQTLLAATVRALEQLTVDGLRLSALDLAGTGAELIGPPQAGPTATVVDRIAEVVEQRPQATALATTGLSVSYGEAWERAGRLAALLAADGLGTGDRIGVMVPRSPDLLVAILGVLRAGAAYVPLDPGYPRAHLEGIVEDAKLAAVVTAGVDDPPRTGRVVDLPTALAAATGPAPDLPGLDDVAYIIHTSGSTGRPKGVVVDHRNLASSTAARHAFYGDPVGAFLLLSSASFDSSVAGIFWTLTSGGTLVLPDEGGERDVEHLRGLLSQHDVTHLLALPSLHRVLAEEGGPLPDTLGCAIVAGEAVDAHAVQAHFANSEGRLFNEYGPTEGTVWASVAELHPDEVTGSIGTPIPGMTVRVVDHLGTPVPHGFAGELVLAGPGVVSGYLADDAATAAAFVRRDGRRWYRTGDRCAVDETGAVVFLGRTDGQVKIRGHRIEPSGVEAALRASPGVTDAAARAVTHDRGATLVGYVVGDVDLAALREDLAARLPRHLVPGSLVPLAELPRLPSGKVDATALPDPDLERDADRTPPTTTSETLLATIWTELLGLDELGIDEDFFDLGGDSILAITMVSQARREGLRIDPSDAVGNPTVRGLARVADRIEDPDAPEADCLVVIRADGDRTPLVCIHSVMGEVVSYRLLADHLPDDQPLYAFAAPGLDGEEEPLQSLPAMASRYVDELVRIQPEGPYRLLGECFGGSVGLEMARLLEERGSEVSQIAILDGVLPWEDARAVTLTTKARVALRDGGVGGLLRAAVGMVQRRTREAIDTRFGDVDTRYEAFRQRVEDAAVAAFGRFTPSRVDAPILLIRAAKYDRPTGEGDSTPAWADYTSELVVEQIDADHHAMLREPAVGDVARLVDEHDRTTRAG